MKSSSIPDGLFVSSCAAMSQSGGAIHVERVAVVSSSRFFQNRATAEVRS